jgi:hypothetical protein
VDNSKNENVIVFHEIDDPVISKNHFSKILPIELGNDASNVVVLEKCPVDSTMRSTNVIAWRMESRAIKFSMS